MIVLLVGLGACGGTQEADVEATRSSDDVLRTAEAIAAQTREATTATPSSTPPTPSPTAVEDTATIELTPTPGSPIALASYNANVRNGPDESYEVIDFFLAGQEADVIGWYQNPSSGMWWFIKRIGPGLNGWVWGGAIIISGDTSGVPMFEPPPTATASPKPTNPPSPTETPAPTAT
jgi:hypothetical protein